MRGGILCLERVWYDGFDNEDRESVAPVIRLVAALNGVRESIFTCGTRDELARRLQTKKLRGFAVLYLAMHGRSGLIETEEEDISLEELSKLMRTRFSGFAVHLGSCGTLSDLDAARRFKRVTGARLVSGYNISVGWDAANSALEVAWLSALVNGRRKLNEKLYKGLIRKNGLVIL